ncbi:hypothetical protein SUGI_0396770 [Cryptomeria japonica]|nr:hypothetical protein SUGI_0396770 [Cryptomeria japonica]
MNSLDLPNNFLSGGIPPELGNLKLSVFNVSNNRLFGRIPDALDSTTFKEGFLGNLRLCGANVIGSGGVGKVYKVILHNGQVVDVKKIRSVSRLGSFKRKGEEEDNKSGEVEVDTLGLIRHNILKLLCFISSEESNFKLLVYEYMPNGSLFDCLHGGPETLLQ